MSIFITYTFYKSYTFKVILCTGEILSLKGFIVYILSKKVTFKDQIF